MSWGLLQNSFLVALGTALAGSFSGVATALFAATLPHRGRMMVLVLAVAGLAFPGFLQANTWMYFFGLSGVLKDLFSWNLYSLQGTVLLLASMLWPVSFLFCLGAVLRMEKVYLEQEPLLRGPGMLRYLFWPQCRAGIAQGFALTFVLALNNFSIPALLQTKVYAAEVWLRFNTDFDYWKTLQLSWALILLPLALLLGVYPRSSRFLFRFREMPPELLRDRLSWVFAVSGGIAFIALLMSPVLPLVQLLANSRTWSEFLPAIEAGSSAAQNTLLFAMGGATASIIFGLAFSRFRLPFLTWLFFLVPAVLLGILLIWTFNRPWTEWIYQSAAVVLIGLVLRFFAPAWMAARLARGSVDPKLVESVTLMGGSAWAQFRWGEWPRVKYPLLAAFYFLYLLCLWEVETLILIIPPGRETLGLRVFNMLHYGHASQVNALCVWLLLLALLPMVLYGIYRAIALARKLQVGNGALASALACLLPLLVSTGCTDAPGNKVQSSIFSSVQVIGSRGTGPGQFNKPRSLAVDAQDNLFVVDITGRVQKFSPEGKFLLQWQMPQTDKGKPKGMIQDIEGNVILIEPHYSRVNHFDGSGKLLSQWGVHGEAPGNLLFPRCAAVNSHGEIYLAEYGQAERIQHFTHHGITWLNTFGQQGTKPGELNRAEGLGVDEEDRLYVADSCNHRIQVFSREGRYLNSFGAPGTASGQLSYPYDIRIDSLGYRFVCEFGNSRIQVFDRNDRSLEIIGEAGLDPGQMHNPWSIALDSVGNLYVADSGNHRVQKFLRREPLSPERFTSKNGQQKLAQK